MALPVKTKGMVNHKSDTSTKKAPSTIPLYVFEVFCSLLMTIV